LVENRLCATGNTRRKIRGNENKNIGQVQDGKAAKHVYRAIVYDWLDLYK